MGNTEIIFVFFFFSLDRNKSVLCRQNAMVRLLIICLFNERRGKERIFVEICYSNRKQVAKRHSFLAFSWSGAKQEKKLIRGKRQTVFLSLI